MSKVVMLAILLPVVVVAYALSAIFLYDYLINEAGLAEYDYFITMTFALIPIAAAIGAVIGSEMEAGD